MPVYVGFSGGADSTALLLALHLLHWPVVAVHFNHHLRGDASDADESWCRRFCETHDIELEVIDLQVNEARKPGEGIESAARRLRLAAWERQCAGDNWRPIFVAHHADDSLEELFLRLARGSNASGRTRLRPVRGIGNLKICRPFLKLRKHELEEWLGTKGVPDWRLDQTNLDADSSRRNAVRNRLLPLVREIFGNDLGILASLQNLREDAGYLEEMAARELEEAGDTPSLAFWQALDLPMLVRVFRRWARLPMPPSRMTLLRLKQAIASGACALVPLGATQWVRVGSKGLRLVSGEVEPPEPVKWNWQRSREGVNWNGIGRFKARCLAPGHWEEEGELFDEKALPQFLVIRAMRPGDVIQVFGGEHHKKISDLFREHQVPIEERRCYPLVCAEDVVIWVPGICRAQFGEVSGSSTKAVHLTFDKT